MYRSEVGTIVLDSINLFALFKQGHQELGDLDHVRLSWKSFMVCTPHSVLGQFRIVSTEGGGSPCCGCHRGNVLKNSLCSVGIPDNLHAVR